MSVDRSCPLRALILALPIWLVLCPMTARSGTGISTAFVGDPGNAPDDTGYREVAYPYMIGTYEVTAGQYTAFLNAVASSDPYGLYDTQMSVSNHGYGCNIVRDGSPGSYSYRVEADWADRPVNFVTWGDAARYANWMHNGQPHGNQGLGTTENGAYALSGATDISSLMAVTRQTGWQWALPTADEWYKAAYYSPTSGGYYEYATSSDALPDNAVVDPDPGNNATYASGSPPTKIWTIGEPYYRTRVGEHENSVSPYGTHDQSGNVQEWNQDAWSSSKRMIQGGCWHGYPYFSASTPPNHHEPDAGSYHLGFRLVRAISAPDPAPRPDPIPGPPSAQRNLVVVTHGWVPPWASQEDVWQPIEELGTAVANELGADSNWDVYGYPWLEKAQTKHIRPDKAYNRALEEGRRLGKTLADGDYDNIHFIAHSAGSALISVASEWIAVDDHDTTIHTTFLDPYMPLGSHGFYGDAADWADQYFSKDIPFTGGTLDNAHNVDVTWLDPNLLGQTSSHGWPVTWYTSTVDGSAPDGSGVYGYGLSREAGGWAPSSYPVGNDPILLGGGNPWGTTVSVRTDAALDLASQPHAASDTGAVNITGTEFSMQTGSPVWLTTGSKVH